MKPQIASENTMTSRSFWKGMLLTTCGMMAISTVGCGGGDKPAPATTSVENAKPAATSTATTPASNFSSVTTAQSTTVTPTTNATSTTVKPTTTAKTTETAPKMPEGIFLPDVDDEKPGPALPGLATEVEIEGETYCARTLGVAKQEAVAVKSGETVYVIDDVKGSDELFKNRTSHVKVKVRGTTRVEDGVIHLSAMDIQTVR